MQRDLVVPSTLLNLIHSNYRNSCSRAVSLANRRHIFLIFVIFKVNEHFQGLKTTLIFLYVLSFFICQHALHLLNSNAAERDVASVTPSFPEIPPYHLRNHDTDSSFFQLTLKEMLQILQSSFPSEIKFNYKLPNPVPFFERAMK